MVKNKAGRSVVTRLLRRLMPWLLGLFMLAGLGAWLTFQHKPAWYQPAAADDDVLQRARRDAPNLADTISDHLVRGQSIEVVLSERSVNEWLAALPHVWPEAERRLPPELSRPAVSFERGVIRLGAHVERSGWRTIAGLTLIVELAERGDAVVLRVIGVQGGSLPVPGWVLEPMIDRGLAGLRSSGGASNGSGDVLRGIETADELFDGVVIPNRFVWPNGRRPFRLAELSIKEDEARLRLEPL